MSDTAHFACRAARADRHLNSRLRLGLLGALLAFGLGTAGPVQAQKTSASPAAPIAESPTLQRISDTGVIVLGYRVGSIPFSYLDARLKPIGYSMDLCFKVVDAVRQKLELPDLEVKLVPVSSATRLALVANGSLDLECGVTTNTAERAKSQGFSITTFVSESKIMTRKASDLNGIDDLSGLTVASTIGTTSIQYLHALNQSRKLNMKILMAQEDPDAFRMLQTGRADAYVMDDVLMRSLLAQTPNPGDFVINDTPLSVEPYGLGLNRDDPVFKQLVDAVIIGIYQRGEIYALYQKWFQAPVPPKGINLQMPMSESFKRVIQKPTDSSDPARYR
ncbi:MAG: amino acid ABC transporter substrate-binding protein [Burkholderiaceae bacterium]|nr:amino acid ABC transporter substrate-binding protein [Roseateles sp.]MBV8471511.1 amino acid ABC transporter substrate-binding protein [Burkholderiaceae bacterium]